MRRQKVEEQGLNINEDLNDDANDIMDDYLYEKLVHILEKSVIADNSELTAMPKLRRVTF